MNTKIFLSAALASSLLILAGCGKAQKPQEYKPLIPSETMASVIYDFEKVQSGNFGEFLKAQKERLTKDIQDYTKEIPEYASKITPEIEEFNKQIQEELKNIKWYIATIERPEIKDLVDSSDVKNFSFPEASYVLCFKNPKTSEDVEKIFCKSFEYQTSVADEKCLELIYSVTNGMVISEVTLSNVKAKSVKFPEDSPFYGKNFEPTFGIYDGVLAIFASSPDAFANVVNLYSGKVAPISSESNLAKKGYLSGDVFANVVIDDINGFLRDNITAIANDEGAWAKLLELNSLNYGLKLREASEELIFFITLGTTSEEIAKSYSEMINSHKGVITMGTTLITAQVKSLSYLCEITQSLDVKAEGTEISATISFPKTVLEKINLKEIFKDIEKFCPIKPSL